MKVETSDIDALVTQALQEDLPDGKDVTTDFLLSGREAAEGVILAKAAGILAGTEPVRRVFQILDSGAEVRVTKKDGERIRPGDEVMRVKGSLSAILRGERTALNFLCHLSGIASLTAQFVEAVRGHSVAILGTRKTTPGLRMLEVEAVRCGGGDCYRTSLSQALLIKDNHLVAIGGLKNLARTLKESKERSPEVHRDILEHGKLEVTSVDELKEGVGLGFKHFLLDNFSVAEVKHAVQAAAPGIFLEVSGGVSLKNVRDYAETGVQAISIGALTHSAVAIDLSLEIVGREP
jgi:nicotinate-nucleotide pyrophosphorylase (carboxylating)